MAKHQNPGTASPGDLESTVKPAWFMPEELVRRPISELIPYARNARTHSPEQIRQLRASLREFGFVNPVLIDSAGNIIAGHGRVLAAEAEGMDEVPCVLVEHLSDAQRRAYILADNRLAEMSGWDLDMVALELEDLQLEGMDLSITGFNEVDLEMEDPNAELEPETMPATVRDDAGDSEPIVTNTDLQQAAAEAFDAGMEAATLSEESDEYLEFVEKFKPKKTTDDCYTPPLVYEAVRDWVVQRYALEDRPIVRPFYPGGDYTKLTYPDGAVVIDNPPFSILAEILEYYRVHHIDYFLFAPGLTVLNYVSKDGVHAVFAHNSITYENGANVCTNYLTNLGRSTVEVSAELNERVKQANKQAQTERKQGDPLPKYSYPAEVATSAGLGYLAMHGESFNIDAESCTFCRALDMQREQGKGIFGGGLLLGQKAAAEKAAAEKAAAEKAAAEKAAAEKWVLSERELEIVANLK